jgi:hypothetical protein
MTTVNINECKQYLEQVENLRQSHGKHPDYVTPYQYILNHGREYGPRVFPKGIKKGTPRLCYMNAFDLASRNHKFKYVEGVATNVIPVDHAWCVNEAGEVVDPTWDKTMLSGKERNADYFGVEIPIPKLYEIMMLTRTYGVFAAWEKWDKVLKILESK